MAKKATITRIRTLYAIFIGVIALCIALFFLNVFTSADPIEVANLGENKSDYGMLITDLQSGPKLYQQNFDVDGLPEGLSANAKVSRYDIGIVADDMEALPTGKAAWCMWLQIVCVLAGTAMTVLVVMALISFYIYTRRGKIFPKKNITWLTWAGVLMILMSLGMDIGTYLERSIAFDLLQQSQWAPAAKVSIHITRILFGLTIIFMAEIFKIGRDIQEEQELTI
ncbi:MAG: DUF2975 domain-containing protein [Bacteroidales bacterium]|nr:DUF2975 domain-containing protein [Bacteroidales bacterium]